MCPGKACIRLHIHNSTGGQGANATSYDSQGSDQTIDWQTDPSFPQADIPSCAFCCVPANFLYILY